MKANAEGRKAAVHTAAARLDMFVSVVQNQLDRPSLRALMTACYGRYAQVHFGHPLSPDGSPGYPTLAEADLYKAAGDFVARTLGVETLGHDELEQAYRRRGPGETPCDRARALRAAMIYEPGKARAVAASLVRHYGEKTAKGRWWQQVAGAI